MLRIVQSRREGGETKNRNHVEEKAVRSVAGPFRRHQKSLRPLRAASRRYDVLATEGVRILPEIFGRERE